MYRPKILLEAKKRLKVMMHTEVDRFCDNLQSEREDEVKMGLKKVQNNIIEASLDTVAACCQDSYQEELQELRKEVYCRKRSGREGPGFKEHELSPKVDKKDPEVDFEKEKLHNTRPDECESTQEPGESFCDWVQRQFQEMLQGLQTMWQKVLAWVKEKMTMLFEAVKAIYNIIKNFCFPEPQYFCSS